MGLNPFGEESDSVHAWRERFKQQQFQTQTLQQTLATVKSQLEELQQRFGEMASNLELRERELSDVKQELVAVKKISKDRERAIQQLEQTIQSSQIERIMIENDDLKKKVEQLQSKLLRVGEKDDSNELMSAIIPVILHEFDPMNPKYEDSFVNLVETTIRTGDTLAKIVSILVKYGGSGPIAKLEELVNSKDFHVAIELLENEGIIKSMNDSIMISTQKEDVIQSITWQNLDEDQLFQNIRKVVNTESDDVIIHSLEKLRDTLQEREIPLTTIFFEIRKVIERIQKGNIVKEDLISQIDTWYAKIRQVIDQK